MLNLEYLSVIISVQSKTRDIVSAHLTGTLHVRVKFHEKTPQTAIVYDAVDVLQDQRILVLGRQAYAKYLVHSVPPFVHCPLMRLRPWLPADLIDKLVQLVFPRSTFAFLSDLWIAAD